MAEIFSGTSGWAYASWKPAFYPPKLASKKFLEHYASQLNAVEVNYTFRRLLTEKTIDAWIAVTPPTFRFAVKCHQGITHYKRLKGAEESVKGFFGSLEPLQRSGRLGPVLFQLPPNLKCDVPLLTDFLAVLPRAARSAFEFRHVSWFDDRVYEALRGHNAALCLAENEDLQTPEVITADFGYYRFRRPDYSAEQKSEIAKRLQKTANAVSEVFAFFKHEENPESALNALEVRRALAAKA